MMDWRESRDGSGFHSVVIQARRMPASALALKVKAKGRNGVPAFAANQTFRAERDTTLPKTWAVTLQDFAGYFSRHKPRGRMAGRDQAGPRKKPARS